MSSEITDKRFVLMLRGNIRLWLNDSEVELLKQVLKNGTPFFEIQGMLISSNSVLYIVSGELIDQTDKIKRGEWQCKECKRWHPRNEECGCQGGRY